MVLFYDHWPICFGSCSPHCSATKSIDALHIKVHACCVCKLRTFSSFTLSSSLSVSKDGVTVLLEGYVHFFRIWGMKRWTFLLMRLYKELDYLWAISFSSDEQQRIHTIWVRWRSTCHIKRCNLVDKSTFSNSVTYVNDELENSVLVLYDNTGGVIKVIVGLTKLQRFLF